MKTLSYIKSTDEEIEIGAKLHFGQLWDGDGDGEELLESGCIAVYEKEKPEDSEEPEYKEYIVAFEVVKEDKDDIFDTLVRVTDIY